MARAGSGSRCTATVRALYPAGTLDQAAVAPSTSFDVICLPPAFALFLGSLTRGTLSSQVSPVSLAASVGLPESFLTDDYECPI